MDSRHFAAEASSRSSRVAKYAALLAGLERSCRIAPATVSHSPPRTESEERCCAASRHHVSESPHSFPALSSTATDLHSTSTSFASYSPLTAQRRSERASAVARTPSTLFDVRVHRRRRKGVHDGVRQDCEAFAQSVHRGCPCALWLAAVSVDAPAKVAGPYGTQSSSARAVPTPRPGDTRRARGAGSVKHGDGVAAHFALTSDDYLSHYLARYGGQFLTQSSYPNPVTSPSVARKEDVRNGKPVLTSELSDVSESLLSSWSFPMYSSAALPVLISTPGCSPIVAPGDGTRISSADVACRLFSPDLSPESLLGVIECASHESG
ncbi:hypothetical protein JIQ42_00813 [Leishmania sp. Namibia]|uniref:hypothetical protein n=1 Tax=Leishmania sp. Namibia TaxID=2802991 RepID=UPI001B3DD00B|nr:hypothetical protein JIQ42_00813 [Leishmania sp. Namibia]